MLIFKTKNGLQDHLKKVRNGKKVVFVPTMGALHQGHLCLVKEAKKEADLIVVSIYINPTQFNNIADLEKYPRQEEQDLELLKKEVVDFVFLPKDKEMYPDGLGVDLDFELEIFNTLEGKFRPGHFAGVCSIVKKLFDIVMPEIAYFGQKDLQQTIILKEMVKQYKLPVEIKVVPTIREESGLAMSSRNQRLTVAQRKQSVLLSQILEESNQEIRKILKQSHKLNEVEILKKISKIKQKMLLKWSSDKVFKAEYLEICNAENLKELDQINEKTIIAVLIAGYIGKIRLIDNIIVKANIYF